MNSDVNVPITEGSPANAAITLLIDLAQRGEIDPWDVDVIKVVDRFFQELNELNLNQSHLPRSGQAFLWASMLVSLKADTLEALASQDEDDDDTLSPDFSPEEENSSRRRLPQKLEHHIRRRGSAPPPKKRRVTLSELITHLKDLASQIEESPGKSESQQQKHSASKRETAQMISHLAHNENLTEMAQELEDFLRQWASFLAWDQNWISLETLVSQWEQEKGNPSPAELQEETTTKANRVGIFWALLLLSAQSKVELSQEEFYQDLNLRFIQMETANSKRAS